jgi:predicted DNA-binding transcriptional regulator AlpA
VPVNEGKMTNSIETPPAALGDAAERYLTPQQFCAIYNIAPRTAERWRVTGDGPKWVRLGLRKVGYRLSDCEAWAAARTFAHRADELTREAPFDGSSQ